MAKGGFPGQQNYLSPITTVSIRGHVRLCIFIRSPYTDFDCQWVYMYMY